MRVPPPRVLIGSGLVLLAAVAIAIGVRGLGGRKAAAPPTTATSSAPTTTTTGATETGAATTANGITISAARVTATPFSATVTWRTTPATTGRVSAAFGGLQPTLWSAADGPSETHRATIGGLAFASDYALDVSATTADGRRADLGLSVSTPKPDTAHLVATTRGTSILLDGQPFFPLLVWGQCPSAYADLVAAGMNLFAENPCGGVPAQLDALGGSALSTSVAGESDLQDPSVIGWFYPDEADGHGLTGATLPAVPPSGSTGRLSFLTLSNHFYSQTAPLAAGRAIYPGLVAKADVVGFDLYPLQVMCWPDRIGAVYDAQRELIDLAPGKPTFQWIEAQAMQCPPTGATAVTPATVRAESWLAIAAGATGLGFFPADWTGVVGDAVRELATDVKALQPALLADPVQADAGGSALRVGARELSGALYVIAANPQRVAAGASIRVAGLGDRELRPLDGGPPVTASGGGVHVTLPPLGAAVWVAPPAGA